MAKTRQIFTNAAIEIAQRRRICHHNPKKHPVAAGERCLVLKDSSSGSSRNYCVECGTAILDRAQTDLDGLRAQLLARSE